MSIVRWGVEGSQVYIYGDVGGGYTCCGCDDGYCLSSDDMVKHVEKHVSDGHIVPGWVIDCIKEPDA